MVSISVWGLVADFLVVTKMFILLDSGLPSTKYCRSSGVDYGGRLSEEISI